MELGEIGCVVVKIAFVVMFTPEHEVEATSLVKHEN